MKIKIEIELDTLRDEQELSDLLDLIARIRDKQDED
jgi:hypothetical protein